MQLTSHADWRALSCSVILYTLHSAPTGPMGPTCACPFSDAEGCTGTPCVQVRFDGPVCISGIKVGAAPGTAPKPAAGDPAPYVRLFGRKLVALPAAKFSVVRVSAVAAVDVPVKPVSPLTADARNAHS